MSKLRRVLASALVGILLAILGILIHNSFSPIGLLLALLESAIGINYLGTFFGSRKLQFLGMLTWLLTVYRAGSLGVSQELLVAGDRNGTTFFLGGLILMFLIVVLRKRTK